jgi:hypothetical protein
MIAHECNGEAHHNPQAASDDQQPRNEMPDLCEKHGPLRLNYYPFLDADKPLGQGRRLGLARQRRRNVPRAIVVK